MLCHYNYNHYIIQDIEVTADTNTLLLHGYNADTEVSPALTKFLPASHSSPVSLDN